MCAKVFAQMYTGSMFGAGMHVYSVWTYILANADAKGYVEINPRVAAVTLGGTETDVQSAIDYLSSIDENSRNPDEEGRRIVREGQFLYRIVSYLKYREMRDLEQKREYNRERQRRFRERQRNAESFTKRYEEQQLSELSQVEVDAYSFSANASSRGTKRPVKTEPSVDPRHSLFKQDFEAYFLKKNGAQASWDGREGKAVSKWLTANPTITRAQWQTILDNRANSPVAQAIRLSAWIDKSLTFLSGPPTTGASRQTGNRGSARYRWSSSIPMGRGD